MRMLVAVALLAGCPRGATPADREALQDFLTTERALLARAEEIVRDKDLWLSTEVDLTRAIETDLVRPWVALRDRITPHRFPDAIRTPLHRYFDERALAWEELRSAVSGRYVPQTVNHERLYREQDAAAVADRALVEAELAKLRLPALPPLKAGLLPALQAPPSAPPGPAYFLVDRTVVRLDDAGFRTIITDVDTMDVLPDGTLWACSMWHIARWDGQRAIDYRPEVPSEACAAAPDGSLWVVDDRYYDEKDRLGHFDGKKWTVTPVTIGDGYEITGSLVIDRDGHLFAINRSPGSGDHRVMVLDKTWRALWLEGSSKRGYVNMLFRGADGHAYAVYQVGSDQGYPYALARMSIDGGEKPVFIDDHSQLSDLHPFVDPTGVFTVVDARRSRLVQAKASRTLPFPVAQRHMTYDSQSAFWFDGSGRMWIDLADGLNVIDASGQRTVYPRGSIAQMRQPIRQLSVVGGGPTLVAPAAVATRTITGSLKYAGRIELMMCGNDTGEPCPDGLPRWSANTTGEGAFTFDKVPRWNYRIFGRTGSGSDWRWRQLNVKCCDADTLELDKLEFYPDPQY